MKSMMKPKKPKSKIGDPFDLQTHFDDLLTFKNYIQQLNIHFVKTNKKIEYANIPCTIDIESSSFIDDGNKTAIMYCFTLGINGHSYLGRTYDELFSLLNFIIDSQNISLQKRLIIYVHNLGYEFQFFYKHFTWERVFAINPRTPLKALTTSGIEFRCSLLLSGYSLAKTGEHLTTYKANKKSGDLDYRLIRHSKTPLTSEEMNYVLYDGIVVMNYIQEQIESHRNNISYIPQTKTGAVRKYVRDVCLYGNGKHHGGGFYQRYKSIINGTNIQSVNEYKQLKRAFSGGFTHANALIVKQTLNDVASFDFTSSYPFVMVSEKFPMLRGELITIHSKEEFEKNINLYCCLMDITFINIESKIWFEHYISSSHCWNLENETLDNGRIVRADKLSITITEQDFFIIKECYKWEKMKVKNFRRYKRDYLPKPFIESILHLYKTKTELKGIKGKEPEYLHSKELLNSCYGMCVTDICRNEIVFDVTNNKWLEINREIDYEKDIKKYNNSKNRFLSYAWGVWVTAYARRNLWNGILNIGSHYCYSDTDSIKLIHKEQHDEYFENYNKNVLKKLERVSKFYNIPMDYFSPKDIDGNVHTIGFFDYEFTYRKFKTLGAKRYMVEYQNGEQSLTISGVNKKTAIPYLQYKYKNIFDAFDEMMYIPPTYTKENDDTIYIGCGKNIHTYIDEERHGIIKDYLGNYAEYHELSCVHMVEGDYTLTLANEFVEFLLQIQRKEFN